MKYIKNLLAAVVLAALIAVPVSSISRVSAQPVDLLCSYEDGEFIGITSKGCDLAITKQVKINEGVFQNADALGNAVQAKVGDTVTWKITVTNNSTSELRPFGIVVVKDAMPSSTSATSTLATVGTFADNSWNFTIDDEMLPATLTITGKATAAGVVKNVATLTDYDPNNCEGPCGDPPFVDANSANNSNAAFLNVASPVVATTSTPEAPKTGLEIHEMKPWQTLAIYTVAAAALIASAVGLRKYEARRSTKS